LKFCAMGSPVAGSAQAPIPWTRKLAWCFKEIVDMNLILDSVRSIGYKQVFSKIV
jgi:hypothetical protein